MSKKQVERAYRKLWDSATKHDGYQAFGYDRVTLRISKPGLLPAIARLRAIWNRAVS